MLGLAQMVWLAACYRASAMRWDRCVEFAEMTKKPLSREIVEAHAPDFAPFSREYYRIIDQLEIDQAFAQLGLVRVRASRALPARL